MLHDAIIQVCYDTVNVSLVCMTRVGSVWNVRMLKNSGSFETIIPGVLVRWEDLWRTFMRFRTKDFPSESENK